jgi:hypothetical protein
MAIASATSRRRLPTRRIGPRNRAMQRVFDIGDRARLPWRFFGAWQSALA